MPPLGGPGGHAPTSLQRESFMSLFGGVRSYLYELSPMKNGWQSIVGHGFGHGVGMSQWGAQLFATRGKKAEEIGPQPAEVVGWMMISLLFTPGIKTDCK